MSRSREIERQLVTLWVEEGCPGKMTDVELAMDWCESGQARGEMMKLYDEYCDLGE